MREALENTLMGYTRAQLEVVLPDELQLVWQRADYGPEQADTKRALILGYVSDRGLPALIALARQVLEEHEIASAGLQALVDAFDHRNVGVPGAVKNLIFAANGPKPDLVLRDAVSNDVEIATNGEHCLVYDEAVADEGLTFRHLVDWWRRQAGMKDAGEVDVARSLYGRLRESLRDNGAELAVFDAYGKRYGSSLDAPALVPQVYLHYDPKSRWDRAALKKPGPLARQRMDFLLLPGDRRRIVIEVDGKQHYSDGDAASPRLYAEMVAEDRELRLRGYEVYRFGGYEFLGSGAEARVIEFFDRLLRRSSS